MPTSTSRRPRPCKTIPPIPQAELERIAHMATYSIDVNPKQVLSNNVGLNLYVGGDNVWSGESAAELDNLIAHLRTYFPGTAATQRFSTQCGPVIYIDIGSYEGRWMLASIDDVIRLREAFFALYGLNKQNWYQPPLSPPP